MQGAISASRTVSTWGQQANMASLDILMVAPDDLVAPSSIWFEAIELAGFGVSGPGPGETYDPSFHEITYVWEFDDVGGFDADVNIPEAWNDRNIAYGKRAAHVFRAPGTYQVRLWAVDQEGRTGEATTTITVANPETAYPGGRTICYDSSGNFTGAPAGAQQVTSPGSLESAVGNLTQSGRVLFRRGSDQLLSVNFNGATYDQNIRFGAFGSGARPILRPPFAETIFSMGQNAGIKDVSYESLDIRGRWDPTTESGSPEDKAFSVLGRNVVELTTTIHDCRFTGLSTIDVSSIKALPFTSIVSDSVIEDWCLYGFFSNRQNDGVNDNSRIALIGTAIQQNPDACNGADTGGFHGIQNQNGPFRYSSARKILLRSSYFFSNASWTVGSQPTMRMMTGHSGGCSAIADRVAFEGGSIVLSIQATPNVPGNFLFDKILVVGTADTINFVRIGAGGTTLRNAFMWHPDAPNIGYGAGPSEYINNTGGGSDAENLVTPVALHNISVLDELSGSSRVFSDLDTDFVNFTQENNLTHAPNKTTPVIGAAPLETSATLAGFTPRYTGRRDSISRPQVETGSQTSAGASLTFSYPTGPSGGSMSAADFNASGGHFMRNLTNGDYHYLERGDISISLGGSITVTNTSGSAMPAGDYRLVLEYNGNVTDTQYASPTPSPLMRPVSGSAAYRTAANGFVSLHDFFGQMRPGFPVSGSGPETASRGAFEPQ